MFILSKEEESFRYTSHGSVFIRHLIFSMEARLNHEKWANILPCMNHFARMHRTTWEVEGEKKDVETVYEGLDHLRDLYFFIPEKTEENEEK